MKTIVVKRTINAPIEQVFERMTDLSNYASFPGVRHVRFIREGLSEKNGVGALREVDAGIFLLQEEILKLERPHRMEYRIYKSRPHIQHESGSMALRTVDIHRKKSNATGTGTGTGTEVIWTSTFSVPLPLLSGMAEFIGGKASELAFSQILKHVERQLTA